TTTRRHEALRESGTKLVWPTFPPNGPRAMLATRTPAVFQCGSWATRAMTRPADAPFVIRSPTLNLCAMSVQPHNQSQGITALDEGDHVRREVFRTGEKWAGGRVGQHESCGAAAVADG